MKKLLNFKNMMLNNDDDTNSCLDIKTPTFHGKQGLVFLCVLMISIGVIISFAFYIKAKIIDQSTVYLKDATVQSEKYLSTIFLNSRRSILSIANLYEKQMTSPEVDYKDFPKLLEYSPFSNLRFIDKNGMGIDSNGTKIDLSDREYFKKGISGKAGVDAVFGSRFTHDVIFLCYAPLYYKGEVIGVFTGVHSEKWLTNILKRSCFDYEALAYLCLRNGDTFASSEENRIEPRNLLDYYQHNGSISEEVYEGLQKCFEEGSSYHFKYKASDGKMENAFAITNERGVWVMVLSFPHSVTDKMIDTYNGAILRMELICIMLFIIYVIYVMLMEVQRHKLVDARAQKIVHKTSLNLADTVSVLSDYYYSVIKVNLKDDSFEMIKINQSDKIAFDVDTATEWIKRVATEGYVFADDVENCINFFNREKLIEAFSQGEKKLSFRYRRYVNSELRWVKMEIIKSTEYNDEEPIVMLYVLDIDDDVKKELALEEAYETATKASKAKTAFLSNMSHDIRTPMNAIIGMTAIASVHLDDKERLTDCLSKITVSSKHLLGLINEVLDMSKIESGRVDLENEEFNLSDLIDNLLAMSKHQIEAKKHTLSVSVRDIEHEKVIGDSQRIQQVFMNLMSNAIKYTPEGGIINVVVSEKKTNQQKVGCYEFIFEDNGIGMEAEYLNHLFEPFTRADDERIKEIQGTGLGLSIAKNIVQMMSGDIKVESRLNKGTKFTVTMFLELQEDSEKENVEEFVDLQILVADDDKVACETSCFILDSLGMKSEWVLTGQEAIERVEERHKEGEGFFAVIIDWKMPEMDGIEVTRQIRQRVGKEVPIIIISSYDWGSIEVEARQAGANAFVSKPLFKSRLIAVFHKIMGHEDEKVKQFALEEFKKQTFEGRRVLLVDDNDMNAEITSEILKMAKLEVDLARNGKEAVDKVISASDGYYDIIFMDVQMPVMNGYAATRAIRAMNRDYTSRIPIIAMTANAFADDVAQAKNAGMNEHIAKPLKFDLLMQVLKKWLGEQE